MWRPGAVRWVLGWCGLKRVAAGRVKVLIVSVVDVLVITEVEILQSMSHENVRKDKKPRVHLFTLQVHDLGVVHVPVIVKRQVRSSMFFCAGRRRVFLFWNKVHDVPVVVYDKCVVESVQNTKRINGRCTRCAGVDVGFSLEFRHERSDKGCRWWTCGGLCLVRRTILCVCCVMVCPAL